VQFNNERLAKENKTLLEFDETTPVLGGIIAIPIFFAQSHRYE
jgi:hypothetical protein